MLSGERVIFVRHVWVGMAGNNLPPGVTAADIDKHFGTPAMREVWGVAEVEAVVTGDVDPTGLLDFDVEDAEVVQAEDVANREDMYRKYLYVEFRFKTQYDDLRSQRDDASYAFSVSPADDRVRHVEHVDTEVGG